MILKRKLFSLIFSCLTFCTLNNCMEVKNAESVSEMLEIETLDGCKHTVAKELCLHSEVIRNMLEDCGAGNIPIPLPCISSHALEMLLPMLQLIQNRNQQELANRLNLKSLEELAELLKASNYLDIPLFPLEAVSTNIADKLSSHEVRQQFCNNKDFLHTNGLTELPAELSILIGKKLVVGNLKAYLFDCCSVSEQGILHPHKWLRLGKSDKAGNKDVLAYFDGTVKIRGIGWSRRVNQSDHCIFARASALFNESGDKVESTFDGSVSIWDISELNAIDCYLRQSLTLEQALFLVCAYEAVQNKQPLDCRNCPWLLKYYDGLPDCIQRILLETNAVVVPFSLRRLMNNAIEFVNQYRQLPWIDADIADVPVLALALLGWSLGMTMDHLE